jgi:hypothetical protein
MFTKNHNSQTVDLSMMSSITPSFTQYCCSSMWTWLQWPIRGGCDDIQRTCRKFLNSPLTRFPSHTLRPYIEVTGIGISNVEPCSHSLSYVKQNSHDRSRRKQKLSCYSLSFPGIKQDITSVLSWLLSDSHANMYLSNLRNGSVWCCRCIGLKVAARGYICNCGTQLVKRGKLWH